MILQTHNFPFLSNERETFLSSKDVNSNLSFF